MGQMKRIATAIEENRIHAGELDDPHNEFGNLDFGDSSGHAESLSEINFTKEEKEALELHAERWDLERGGYL
jgi:hypothetical protein